MQDFLIFMQSHATLVTALIAVLFLLAIVEFFRLKTSAQTMSPAAVTLLMNHQKAVVIDLRPIDSFKAGHIIGAMSIPFAEWAQKKQKLDKIKTQPLVVVCANGLESARIANILKKENKVVFILAGGMRSWKEADLPLVKGQ